MVELTEAMRSCDVGDVEETFSSLDLSTMPLLYNTSPILLNSFNQILKIAPDSDSSTVIAAHVKFLVRLPFVAAYMDKFVNADKSQWNDLWESFRHFRRNPVEDKEKFDALMAAQQTVNVGIIEVSRLQDQPCQVQRAWSTCQWASEAERSEQL